MTTAPRLYLAGVPSVGRMPFPRAQGVIDRNFILNFSKKVAYPKELFGLLEAELTKMRFELDTLHNSMV